MKNSHEHTRKSQNNSHHTKAELNTKFSHPEKFQIFILLFLVLGLIMATFTVTSTTSAVSTSSSTLMTIIITICQLFSVVGLRNSDISLLMEFITRHLPRYFFDKIPRAYFRGISREYCSLYSNQKNMFQEILQGYQKLTNVFLYCFCIHF